MLWSVTTCYMSCTQHSLLMSLPGTWLLVTCFHNIITSILSRITWYDFSTSLFYHSNLQWKLKALHWEVTDLSFGSIMSIHTTTALLPSHSSPSQTQKHNTHTHSLSLSCTFFLPLYILLPQEHTELHRPSLTLSYSVHESGFEDCLHSGINVWITSTKSNYAWILSSCYTNAYRKWACS